ncbi:MAG: ABC exporter membrane fusion protein [Nostoc sp.]|uniref:ABC exporter membrane fusion protein n=1 Tax=Nostoc sp. TaxID=1180 RepID=UPI002FFC154F
MANELLSKPNKCWVISLSIVAGLVPIGISVYILQNYKLNFQSRSSLTQTPVRASAVTTIAGLGRLEPQGEVIHLSAAASAEGGVKVAQLLVKEGDQVQPQQVIAILENRDRLLAVREQAKKQVKVAQASLAKVKAGAKVGEIMAGQATIARLQAQLRGQIATVEVTIARLQAQLQGEKKVQQAKISRLEAQLHNAQTEFERYQMLYQQGAVEASKFDSKRLEVETAKEQLKEAKAAQKQTLETLQQQINETEATQKQTSETLQQQINEAKATLNQITEIRPTDLLSAEAEVESAIAALKKSEADLALAYVRSPSSSQILKINARPGEIVTEQGIADLGQTNQMYVVAEIYETDITKVRIGQRATVTSFAFAEQLRGTVVQISSQIEKKSILDTDPTADLDARVVKVKIRLDPVDSKKVAGLTNLQVEGVINISPSDQE